MLRPLVALASISLGTAIAAQETVSEAAHHARTLLSARSDGIGAFMSVFPGNYEADPALSGLPIGGLEYFAPADNGDLYILAMPISKQISNAIRSEHHNATVAIKDEAAERKYGRFGATDRNRVTLFGSLEKITDEADEAAAKIAFAAMHKDAVAYFPGKGPHYAWWARFKVERVYWIGGFGDTHYIGWLPLDMYRNASPATVADGALRVQAI